MKTTFPRWLLSTTFPLCLILLCHCMQAQDTLRLSLKEAEERFLKSNFLLLAKTYDINVAEALAEQAKLWDNPNFQFEFNAYNPNNPTGGAYMFQIQQMINLGQRRSKYVKLLCRLPIFSTV